MTALPVTPAPVVLEVFGVPHPQGSKSAIVRGGRATIVEGNTNSGRAKHKSWREAVAQSARDWQAINGQPLLDEPLRLTVVFRLPRPPSIPKRRTMPDRKPDASKLLRAVEDSLTGIIWADDARVCDLHVTKVYATDTAPGCTITIERLT